MEGRFRLSSQLSQKSSSRDISLKLIPVFFLAFPGSTDPRRTTSKPTNASQQLSSAILYVSSLSFSLFPSFPPSPPSPASLPLSLTSTPNSLRSFVQNSLQILRDNSTLSLHLRNYPLHLANRITLLQLRPNERRNWITLALGFAIKGEPDRAEEVLEGLSKMVKVSSESDTRGEGGEGGARKEEGERSSPFRLLSSFFCIRRRLVVGL